MTNDVQSLSQNHNVRIADLRHIVPRPRFKHKIPNKLLGLKQLANILSTPLPLLKNVFEVLRTCFSSTGPALDLMLSSNKTTRFARCHGDIRHRSGCLTGFWATFRPLSLTMQKRSEFRPIDLHERDSAMRSLDLCHDGSVTHCHFLTGDHNNVIAIVFKILCVQRCFVTRAVSRPLQSSISKEGASIPKEAPHTA